MNNKLTFEPVCFESDEFVSKDINYNNSNGIEVIILDSEENDGYPYRRINHFYHWLKQFRAKTIEIPTEIYDQILVELHNNHVYDLTTITVQKMKQILKKLHLTQCYEHSAYICYILNEQPPPAIKHDDEKNIRKMFRQIQAPFEKHCSENRRNFFNYSYVLYKFCQLLALNKLIKCFPPIISYEKIKRNDKLWEKICCELHWEFIPSV